MKYVWVDETPLEKAKSRLADALREVERCEKAVEDAQYFHKIALEVFRERETTLKALEDAETGIIQQEKNS